MITGDRENHSFCVNLKCSFTVHAESGLILFIRIIPHGFAGNCVKFGNVGIAVWEVIPYYISVCHINKCIYLICRKFNIVHSSYKREHSVFARIWITYKSVIIRECCYNNKKRIRFYGKIGLPLKDIESFIIRTWWQKANKGLNGSKL